jgi:hypothetical protein
MTWQKILPATTNSGQHDFGTVLEKALLCRAFSEIARAVLAGRISPWVGHA